MVHHLLSTEEDNHNLTFLLNRHLHLLLLRIPQSILVIEATCLQQVVKSAVRDYGEKL